MEAFDFFDDGLAAGRRREGRRWRGRRLCPRCFDGGALCSCRSGGCSRGGSRRRVACHVFAQVQKPVPRFGYDRVGPVTLQQIDDGFGRFSNDDLAVDDGVTFDVALD